MKTFIRHNPKEIKENCRGIVILKSPNGKIDWTAAYYNTARNLWIAENSNNYNGYTIIDVYLYEEEPVSTVSSGDDPFAEVFSPIEWN